MTESRSGDKNVIELPIRTMQGFTTQQCEALNARWITTVDAFVAAAATETGRRGLCEVLGMDSGALDALLGNARDLLGKERYARLSVPVPGGPLGALLEEESSSGESSGHREEKHS